MREGTTLSRRWLLITGQRALALARRTKILHVHVHVIRKTAYITLECVTFEQQREYLKAEICKYKIEASPGDADAYTVV